MKYEVEVNLTARDIRNSDGGYISALLFSSLADWGGTKIKTHAPLRMSCHMVIRHHYKTIEEAHKKLKKILTSSISNNYKPTENRYIVGTQWRLIRDYDKCMISEF